jgi:hypothetical protein
MTMAAERFFLTSESIYNYLIGDEELETAIMCRTEEIELATTDQNLYEAIGSVADRGAMPWNKLVKFLENVEVMSHRSVSRKGRSVLTHERVKEIRDLARKERKINEGI